MSLFGRTTGRNDRNPLIPSYFRNTPVDGSAQTPAEITTPNTAVVDTTNTANVVTTNIYKTIFAHGSTRSPRTSARPSLVVKDEAEDTKQTKKNSPGKEAPQPVAQKPSRLKPKTANFKSEQRVHQMPCLQKKEAIKKTRDPLVFGEGFEAWRKNKHAKDIGGKVEESGSSKDTQVTTKEGSSSNVETVKDMSKDTSKDTVLVQSSDETVLPQKRRQLDDSVIITNPMGNTVLTVNPNGFSNDGKLLAPRTDGEAGTWLVQHPVTTSWNTRNDSKNDSEILGFGMVATPRDVDGDAKSGTGENPLIKTTAATLASPSKLVSNKVSPATSFTRSPLNSVPLSGGKWSNVVREEADLKKKLCTELQKTELGIKREVYEVRKLENEKKKMHSLIQETFEKQQAVLKKAEEQKRILLEKEKQLTTSEKERLKKKAELEMKVKDLRGMLAQGVPLSVESEKYLSELRSRQSFSEVTQLREENEVLQHLLKQHEKVHPVKVHDSIPKFSYCKTPNYIVPIVSPQSNSGTIAINYVTTPGSTTQKKTPRGTVVTPTFIDGTPTFVNGTPRGVTPGGSAIMTPVEGNRIFVNITPSPGGQNDLIQAPPTHSPPMEPVSPRTSPVSGSQTVPTRTRRVDSKGSVSSVTTAKCGTGSITGSKTSSKNSVHRANSLSEPVVTRAFLTNVESKIPASSLTTSKQTVVFNTGSLQLTPTARTNIIGPMNAQEMLSNDVLHTCGSLLFNQNIGNVARRSASATPKPEFDVWQLKYKKNLPDKVEKPRILTKELIEAGTAPSVRLLGQVGTPRARSLSVGQPVKAEKIGPDLNKVKQIQLKDVAGECISARSQPLQGPLSQKSVYDPSRPVISPRVPLHAPTFEKRGIKKFDQEFSTLVNYSRLGLRPPSYDAPTLGEVMRLGDQGRLMDLPWTKTNNAGSVGPAWKQTQFKTVGAENSVFEKSADERSARIIGSGSPRGSRSRSCSPRHLTAGSPKHDSGAMRPSLKANCNLNSNLKKPSQIVDRRVYSNSTVSSNAPNNKQSDISGVVCNNANSSTNFHKETIDTNTSRANTINVNANGGSVSINGVNPDSNARTKANGASRMTNVRRSPVSDHSSNNSFNERSQRSQNNTGVENTASISSSPTANKKKKSTHGVKTTSLFKANKTRSNRIHSSSVPKPVQSSVARYGRNTNLSVHQPNPLNVASPRVSAANARRNSTRGAVPAPIGMYDQRKNRNASVGKNTVNVTRKQSDLRKACSPSDSIPKGYYSPKDFGKVNESIIIKPTSSLMGSNKSPIDDEQNAVPTLEDVDFLRSRSHSGDVRREQSVEHQCSVERQRSAERQRRSRSPHAGRSPNTGRSPQVSPSMRRRSPNDIEVPAEVLQSIFVEHSSIGSTNLLLHTVETTNVTASPRMLASASGTQDSNISRQISQNKSFSNALSPKSNVSQNSPMAKATQSPSVIVASKKSYRDFATKDPTPVFVTKANSKDSSGNISVPAARNTNSKSKLLQNRDNMNGSAQLRAKLTDRLEQFIARFPKDEAITPGFSPVPIDAGVVHASTQLQKDIFEGGHGQQASSTNPSPVKSLPKTGSAKTSGKKSPGVKSPASSARKTSPSKKSSPPKHAFPKIPVPREPSVGKTVSFGEVLFKSPRGNAPTTPRLNFSAANSINGVRLPNYAENMSASRGKTGTLGSGNTVGNGNTVAQSVPVPITTSQTRNLSTSITSSATTAVGNNTLGGKIGNNTPADNKPIVIASALPRDVVRNDINPTECDYVVRSSAPNVGTKIPVPTGLAAVSLTGTISECRKKFSTRALSTGLDEAGRALKLQVPLETPRMLNIRLGEPHFSTRVIRSGAPQYPLLQGANIISSKTRVISVDSAQKKTSPLDSHLASGNYEGQRRNVGSPNRKALTPTDMPGKPPLIPSKATLASKLTTVGSKSSCATAGSNVPALVQRDSPSVRSQQSAPLGSPTSNLQRGVPNQVRASPSQQLRSSPVGSTIPPTARSNSATKSLVPEPSPYQLGPNRLRTRFVQAEGSPSIRDSSLPSSRQDLVDGQLDPISQVHQAEDPSIQEQISALIQQEDSFQREASSVQRELSNLQRSPSFRSKSPSTRQEAMRNLHEHKQECAKRAIDEIIEDYEAKKEAEKNASDNFLISSMYEKVPSESDSITQTSQIIPGVPKVIEIEEPKPGFTETHYGDIPLPPPTSVPKDYPMKEIVVTNSFSANQIAIASGVRHVPHRILAPPPAITYTPKLTTLPFSANLANGNSFTVVANPLIKAGNLNAASVAEENHAQAPPIQTNGDLKHVEESIV